MLRIENIFQVGLLIFCFSSTSSVIAQPQPASTEQLLHMELMVGNLQRQLLLHVPGESAKKAPIVFAFHGHGGTAKQAARSFEIEKHWPEAFVVYMQGIPTPGRLTDPQGMRNGWQHAAGEHDDRDLIFFDKVFELIQARHQVDTTRIYATGHSNGGSFTYLLWSQRSDVLAAVAPSASTTGRKWRSLSPKPVMHLAGQQDKLVQFQWQERTIEALKRLNQCESVGVKWSNFATLFPSRLDTPVVTYIHPGAHKYPTEATAQIVKFFKEHQLNVAKQEGR